jgi:hypothetical protein
MLSSANSQANNTISFLKRNINISNKSIKEKAYVSLVRSTLEYASSVWDPYQQNDIHRLEMVQRRAGCCFWRVIHLVQACLMHQLVRCCFSAYTSSVIYCFLRSSKVVHSICSIMLLTDEVWYRFMSQYHQMQMQQTFNRTLTNWLNENQNGP